MLPAVHGDDSRCVARDIFVTLDRCTYCGRPGCIAWDTDLVSCSEEVCQALADAELRRRALRHPGARSDRRSRVSGASGRRHLGARRSRRCR